MIEAPVLLITFNRPDSTKKVFEAIKRANPKKLYIAADAPRIGNLEDEKNCSQVKEIVKQVDWDCEVQYRFAEINQGCGPGPYNAISWAFENEDRLIILEDDCVPALPFFRYCDELLERYKIDTRIWIISGNQYNEEAVKTPHSYFFSRYGHSWGWATWKRCWNSMDMTMSAYPRFIEQDLFNAVYRTKEEADFFQNIFGGVFLDQSLKSHIWDCQFGFTIISNGGLSIIPKKNLVTNIGYGGTHSVIKNEFHDRPVDENFKIISHPEFVLCDVNYDEYHFKNHWNKQTKTSINKKIRQMISRIIRMVPNFVKYRLGLLFDIMERHSSEAKLKLYYKSFNLHPTVNLWQIRETTFRGNIFIDENTYLNRCWIESGPKSKIVIGKWCAIGYNTYIISITHDSDLSTGPESDRPFKEADIIIGDNVWIGANVYIRQGVSIGSNSVIGANSVVTKNIAPNTVNAGVPARLIRKKVTNL